METTQQSKYLLASLIVVLVALGWWSWYERSVPTKVGSTPPKHLVVHEILGTVLEVSGSSLKMKTPPEVQGGVPVKTTEVIVLVNDKTIIKRSTPKDPAVFQKELVAFADGSKASPVPSSGSAIPAPRPGQPLPVTTTVTSLGDIKVGENIFVSSPQDVSVVQRFVASEIVTLTGIGAVSTTIISVKK